MSKTAYLGIGGNIGDSVGNIEKTLELLKENKEIKLVKVSSFYKTEPVGYTDQASFVNIVAKIDTKLEPYDLLEYCQFIEQELKRVRLKRWGPRSIDVDILLYEDFESLEEKLIIPHPRMTERGFVMIPLYEIEKDIEIAGKKIEDLIAKTEYEKVEKMKK